MAEANVVTEINGSTEANGSIKARGSMELNGSTETNGSIEATDGSLNSNGSAADLDGRVATSPNAPDQLAQILQDIDAQSRAFKDGDSGARLRLVGAAQSLLQAMETPQETLLRYVWAQPSAAAAIETCIDLGVFALLAGSEKPKSVTELAEATGAEPELLGRIMKHLGAMGVIVETGLDEYRRNGFATTMAMAKYSDGFPCISGTTIDSVYSIPIWLKANGYRSPTNGTKCPLNMGYKTDLHFFEFLNANPNYPNLAGQFNNFMSAYHQGRPSWMDDGFYPVADRLIKGAKQGDNEVLIVDVGGGKGHDLQEFRSKWPDAAGRLILQDQQAVLDEIKELDASIERTAHDFFTEQPVKGARAYFLHSICHDWPDETCLKILRNLVPSMTPGYSKVLINENVIPDTGAHWQATALDIVMMADFASKERTERQWHKLIESAGLRIAKIWTVQTSTESLIECELA